MAPVPASKLIESQNRFLAELRESIPELSNCKTPWIVQVSLGVHAMDMSGLNKLSRHSMLDDMQKVSSDLVSSFLSVMGCDV